MADVAMPTKVAIFFCKTVLLATPDPNAAFTGHQAREWAYEDSMMVCRREEIPLTDSAVDQGADPVPFTPMQCWRTAMTLGPAWDAAHPNSRWRFWKAACPVPIRSGPNARDPIIGWKLPECGHADTVRCIVDSVI